MLHPEICEALPSATSSPESVSGVTHYAGQDGETIGPSGLEAVHASLSARQAKAAGLLTSGTFVPTSTTSSKNADLKQSLVSRLQAKTDSLGSTLYKLTGRNGIHLSSCRSMRCGLRCAAHQTAPLLGGQLRQRTTERAPGRAAGRGMNLQSEAQLAGWPTPQVSMITNCTKVQMSGDGRQTPNKMGWAASLAGWPTPMAGTPAQNGNSASGNTDSSRKTSALRSPDSRVRNRHNQADASTSAVNGFWRDADWLFCRDGKWRPVEPGSFPLVNGATQRVGRLRAYGNAINAEVAKGFIEAYMETQHDAA